jgi:hypothetical protein
LNRLKKLKESRNSGISVSLPFERFERFEGFEGFEGFEEFERFEDTVHLFYNLHINSSI